MAIPEPGGELWAAVQAIHDPWPPDDEDAARTLAESWQRGGRAAMDAGTSTSAAGNDVAANWPDRAGATAVDRLALLTQRSALLNTRMATMAGAAENYATVLTKTKTDITSAISANEASYQSLGNPAFGAIGAMLQQLFAGKLATNLEELVQARAAGLPPVPAGPGSSTGTGAPPAGPLPPAGGTPQQVADWWKSLSPQQQADLLRNQPALLGNLDGIPANIRDQANRARLPGERAALQQRLDGLRGQLGGIDPDSPLVQLADPNTQHLAQEFRDTRAKLESLDAIQATLNRGGQPGPDGQPEPPRQLLELDTSGLRVKAAVAVGDVDAAQHVGVFVPGFTTTVNGSLAGYDRNMLDLVNRSRKITGQPDGSVAAVTWIGYDAPQWSEVVDPDQSVAGDHAAHVGAEKLNSFLNGLGAERGAGNPPLHLTVLGHSYGSLTAGLALQQPSPVGDAVVFGSPGLDIDNVHDLRVPDGHVYSEIADGDYVPDADITGHFGNTPYGMPGIAPLSTDGALGPGGQPLAASHGHSQYLTDGTTSQQNMAAVVAGRPDLLIPSTRPVGTPWRDIPLPNGPMILPR